MLESSRVNKIVSTEYIVLYRKSYIYKYPEEYIILDIVPNVTFVPELPPVGIPCIPDPMTVCIAPLSYILTLVLSARYIILDALVMEFKPLKIADCPS
jgi:hypothetical protein